MAAGRLSTRPPRGPNREERSENGYCFSGFSLHDELALLAEAGLRPMEAVQGATSNPARFLGKERELGTIEKGELADLVLLEGDLLQRTRKKSML